MSEIGPEVQGTHDAVGIPQTINYFIMIKFYEPEGHWSPRGKGN